MITFETDQECKDADDLVEYILATQFDDFVDFVIQNGCAALTEDELDEFEELDEMINEEGVADPIFVNQWEELVDRAAHDPDTRHVYALATRLADALITPAEPTEATAKELVDAQATQDARGE